MNPFDKCSFVDVTTLGEEGRLAAAYLVIEALPAYYMVEGVDKIEMANSVAGMLGEPGSEIGMGFAALCGDQVGGILNFIRAESLPGARLVGTKRLLKRLPDESRRLFLEHLGNFSADYGDVPSESLYLSRIAIDKGYRGTGLAGKMMDRFLSLNDGAKRKRACFSLHVDRNNERAIAFYRKFGFTTDNTETRYLTMLKN